MTTRIGSISPGNRADYVELAKHLLESALGQVLFGENAVDPVGKHYPRRVHSISPPILTTRFIL